jgi:hypothetical protein
MPTHRVVQGQFVKSKKAIENEFVIQKENWQYHQYRVSQFLRKDTKNHSLITSCIEVFNREAKQKNLTMFPLPTSFGDLACHFAAISFLFRSPFYRDVMIWFYRVEAVCFC